MFNTKNVAAPVNISPYMSMGDQIATIKNIELKEARSGSKQVLFMMETEPVTAAGFKPLDNAKGQVGRVQASIYLKDDKAKIDWITERVLPIAEALGIRSQIDEIECSTFEEYITRVEAIVKDKPIQWLIGGEEYLNQKSEIKVKLMLPRYNFVGGSVESFNKTNQYHFRPYKGDGNFTAGDLPTATPADDLPF